MKDDAETLTRLMRASLGRPQEKRLVCPECGSECTLAGGRLWCSQTEKHCYEKLAELALR